MSDFDRFKNFVIEKNSDEIKNNFKEEFIERILDTSSQKRIIHYAAANGHDEIIKMLIDLNCNLESKTKTKMRAIHLAAKDGHEEIVRMLIEKCNIECKTQYKRRPLHLACAGGHKNIVNLLIEKHVDLESETQNKRRAIHCACAEGHVDVVKLLISHKCNMESATQHGWRPMHQACDNGNLEIVQLLIEQKCDLESESEDKWRPLHCACLKGHLDIVKLLISHDCEIHCTTQDGNTPVNIAQKHGHTECLEFLNERIRKMRKMFDCVKSNDVVEFDKLYDYKTLSMLEYPTGLSVVDVALQANAPEIIRYLKDKKFDEKELVYLQDTRKMANRISSYRSVQECLFYRSIRSGHNKGYDRLLSANLVNGPHNFVLSFLDVGAESGYLLFTREILNKSIYNREQWASAIQIAKQNKNDSIADEIAIRESLLLLRAKSDMSILHTAIYDNDPDMIQYIMNNRLVDKNVCNKTFGTALNLAYLLCYRQCVNALIPYDIDINLTNKYLQSPLYGAMDNGMLINFQYLIDRTCEIDKPGYMGFTLLQYSVVRGHSSLCDPLMNKGANFCFYSKFSATPSLTKAAIPVLRSILPPSTKENCLTLCIKMHGLIYPCFLNLMNRSMVNACDGFGDSLLHLAVKCLKPELCKNLIQLGADVNCLNKSRNSPLLELFFYFNSKSLKEEDMNSILEIVEILVDAKTDVNKRAVGGKTVLQLGSVFNSHKLMLILLKHVSQFTGVTSTDFKLAFSNHWFEYGVKLIAFIPAEILPTFITREVFLYLKNESELTKTMFNKASIETKLSVIEDILLHVALENDDDLFEYFIKMETFSGKLMDNGESLLTNLITHNRNKYSVQLIRSSGNNFDFVNLKNSNGNYPLHVAIKYNAQDILSDLILKTENLNEENNDGETPLMLLFQKMSEIHEIDNRSELMEVIESIIVKGGDIYYTTSKNKTVMSECLDLELHSQVERFFNDRQKQ